MKLAKSAAMAALATLCVVPAAAADRAAKLEPADFASGANALLTASYPADGPGAAAIVTRGERLIYSGGRGIADLEAKRVITPDTPIRLGSITKQFTAAAILQLAAEGKLSLDDPIWRFFPDFPQPGARATVRQLLNHTSGLFDFTKIPGWMGSERSLKPHGTADLVELIRSRPAVSEPGARWEYNNGGYVMLGAIIEKVTGKAWHEVVTQKIARPLGLSTIAYAGESKATAAMARGYSEEAGRYRPASPVHVSVAHAAGGLVGSVADTAKWAQALHGGRVVSPALYQEMISPARLNDGSTEPYGFGLRLREIRGRKALAHGGAGRGLDTDSAYIPREKLFVAVFSNTDDPKTDPSTLTRRLAALALGEPLPSFTPAEVDMRTLEPLFGSYGGKKGPPILFFAREGRLHVGIGDNEMQAFAAGGDRFFFGPPSLTWFRIVRSANSRHAMEVHRVETATPERAIRTGPVPPPFSIPAAALRNYVGTYKTEGPLVTISLGGDGQLSITPSGQPPVRLRPISQTEFRIDGPTPMRVVFHPEGGVVNRLTLYRGARELHGQRQGQ